MWAEVDRCETQDINNQSIANRKRALTINTVTLSQIRGWTLQRPRFCPMSKVWQNVAENMKPAFLLHKPTSLSFVVIRILQPGV